MKKWIAILGALIVVTSINAPVYAKAVPKTEAQIYHSVLVSEFELMTNVATDVRNIGQIPVSKSMNQLLQLQPKLEAEWNRISELPDTTSHYKQLRKMAVLFISRLTQADQCGIDFSYTFVQSSSTSVYNLPLEKELSNKLNWLFSYQTKMINS